jgi:phage portal protein BeeE
VAGLWPFRAEATVERAQNRSLLDGPSPFQAHVSPVPPQWPDQVGMSMAAAMRIPAFRRGVVLISGTVAQLPLGVYRNGQRLEPEQVHLEVSQPEKCIAYQVTMQKTVMDLICFGRAYWLVREVDDGHRDPEKKNKEKDPLGYVYPKYVQHVPADEVSDEGPEADTVRLGVEGPYKKGSRRSGSEVDRVIEFYSPAGGVLSNGGTILNGALSLEIAVGTYANAPMPSMALKNEGADLPTDQVHALLDSWEEARRTRATAYLSASVDVETFGWSARDLQMVEARNESAVQVARLLNLDPYWVGASLPGTSTTYANRVDMRRDLLDLTCAVYMNAIEQRLTMRDVTPTKYRNVVEFDTSNFLRLNLQERVNIVTQLQPLGVISDEQAQSLLAFNPSNTAGGIA